VLQIKLKLGTRIFVPSLASIEKQEGPYLRSTIRRSIVRVSFLLVGIIRRLLRVRVVVSLLREFQSRRRRGWRCRAARRRTSGGAVVGIC
jgi:hypothetical protein